MKSKASSLENQAKATDGFIGGFLFSGIPRGDAERLISGVRFEIKELKKGELLICHGSQTPCFGTIISGRATVSRTSCGKKLILNNMKEGAFFGASSLFGGEAFPTDISADTDCTVATLTEGDIEALLTRDSRIAMNYIRFLSGRIRFLNDSIDSYSMRSADEKIAKHLLRICSDGVGTIGSYTRVADMLGVGRASLYRALDSLENRGIISRQKQEIRILDLPALDRIAFGE